MWAGAQAASRAQFPWQGPSTHTSPEQAKPPSLPERLLQPEKEGGGAMGESPLSSAEDAG